MRRRMTRHAAGIDFFTRRLQGGHDMRMGHMRMGRTLTLLTLFAGLTTWFATRAAMRKAVQRERTQTEDMTRWETDGGATTAGPQPPGATF